MSDKERREAAEARLAEAEKRKQERDEAEALLALERAADDADAVAELEAEHGESAVACVRGRSAARDVAVFVKAPHPNTYHKFAEYGDKITAQRVREFVWPCIVRPSKSDVEEAVKREPHLLYALAGAVARLGGALKADDDAKS
jgi:hypothetical protein